MRSRCRMLLLGVKKGSLRAAVYSVLLKGSLGHVQALPNSAQVLSPWMSEMASVRFIEKASAFGMSHPRQANLTGSYKDPKP